MDTAERVRLVTYRTLAGTGRAPTWTEVATELGIPLTEVDAAVDELVSDRHLVVDDERSVVLAHPFATRPFGFSVMGERTLWWGGCAWDSFAIPHLVPDEPAVLVATTCPACDAPHAWVVDREAPPRGDQVAHFLTPIARVWDDVVQACAHQRIFCSEQCVSTWLADTDRPRGSVFDLATLWRLAAHWYDGRLDSPYRRREPAEAAAYFASAGLRGEFWGG